jgi:hypothetical protein
MVSTSSEIRVGFVDNSFRETAKSLTPGEGVWPRTEWQVFHHLFLGQVEIRRLYSDCYHHFTFVSEFDCIAVKPDNTQSPKTN